MSRSNDADPDMLEEPSSRFNVRDMESCRGDESLLAQPTGLARFP